MCSNGECFVVCPPHTAGQTVIFGRNATVPEAGAAESEAQEVLFYEASEAVEGKSDGGAEPTIECEALRMILQKPHPGVWGSDYGVNERNICVTITWADEPEKDNEHLRATDIVRYALATAMSERDAVKIIGSLVEKHGDDNAKMNFVVCGATEAWHISCSGKLWAAECNKEGCRRFASDGLTVTTVFEESSEGLKENLKELDLWNGEGDLNFADCFGAADAANANTQWIGNAPAGDGTYIVTSMFATLRSSATAYSSRSACVSFFSLHNVSCHWFTGTPNVSESVFKPFVFAPNPKISPLTKVPADETLTLLHKLHAQRKPAAVEDLKALEGACVEEVNKYLGEHNKADEELDELMKDCVEAEVKFYR